MRGGVAAGAGAVFKTAITVVVVTVLLTGCATYSKKQSTMRWGRPGGSICVLPRAR